MDHHVDCVAGDEKEGVHAFKGGSQGARVVVIEGHRIKSPAPNLIRAGLAPGRSQEFNLAL